MIRKKVILVFFIVPVIFIFCTYKGIKYEMNTSFGLNEILKRDTLIVGTMYGPTSYFNYRGATMGYDYEMAEDLANYLNVNLKVVTEPSQSILERDLNEKKIDMIAYDIIETARLKRLFHFVFPQQTSYQVIVQRLGNNTIDVVTDLRGKKVYVKPNTIFYQRLSALNREIGGTIDIVDAPDSISSDKLIEMVAQGKIDYTVAYYKTASLYKSYYKKLDVRLQIGFDQLNGWLVRVDNPMLEDTISKWKNELSTQALEKILVNKYWKKNKYLENGDIKIPKGAISPFDHLFKRYAGEINWDWRLLAAVAYEESGFDSSEVSWAGASGLMQLMPRTAAGLGLNEKTIFNPAKNIEAGVQYIKFLNMAFGRVTNKYERIKFILAAYNCGPSHIFDAMALAEKYGKNPQIWFKNVEYFLTKESEPQFYNDPVVKYGRFHGKETVAYVTKTLKTYERYLRKK